MYIDTHAHIYLDQFKGEYDKIIERANAAQVDQILMPNIDINTLDQVFDLHKNYPEVCKPMLGLHPCSVESDYSTQLEQLKSHLHGDGVIAVGEIGIDLYWDKTFQKEQEEAFRIQISWAKENNLPIVIHSRDSIKHTIRIVSEEQDGNLTGVFHCYGEGKQEANQIMDLGFYMGIGGVITFKKSQELRELIAELPLESILLETDAPYLTPAPYRGKRNESSYIPYIAEVIAEAKGIEIKKVGEVTTANAKNLFRI